MYVMKPAEKVIAAVSGGVDSCVMLHMLVHGVLPGFEHISEDSIIVAHVSHGIRDDSQDDEEFVHVLAETYGTHYESVKLTLGKEASEETARNARYAALDSIAKKYHTTAILIAHHKQDVIETAALNIMRGSGRSGLSSLKSRQGRIRPLLDMTKAQILLYAKNNKLEWREDSTNTSDKYMRNRVRAHLDKRIGTDDYLNFANELQKINQLNTDIDQQIAIILQYKMKRLQVIDRTLFTGLDHALSCELMRHILIKLNVANIDKELIERLVVGLKSARPGSLIDVNKDIVAYITKRSLRFMNRQTRSTHNV